MSSKHPDIQSSVVTSIEQFLETVKANSTMFVAFSGGLDSTVLLHVLNQNKVIQFKKINIIAVYVDHGLQQDSQAWSKHCADFCRTYSIEYISLNIQVNVIARQGLEATARKLRYQAIMNCIDQSFSQSNAFDVFLLTGHHQKDQAETLLLNLFRGAGVNGLAAMPALRILKTEGEISVRHARPFLKVSYDDLVTYAKVQSLPYVVDRTNFETHYKRNQVRHEVLPKLEEVWPGAIDALSKTTQHMSEALYLLDEYAADNLKNHKNNRCFIQFDEWDDFDWIKVKNLIRYWFKTYWPDVVLSLAHYEWIRLFLTTHQVSSNSNHSYRLSNGVIKLYKNRLYYLSKELMPFNEALSFNNSSLQNEFLHDENNFMFFKINGLKKGSKVSVRSILPSDNLKKKALKNFFQRFDVPVWERVVWPVLVVDGRVVSLLGCDRCIESDGQNIDNGAEVFKINVGYSQCLKWWGL